MNARAENPIDCDLAPVFDEIRAAYAAGPAVGDEQVPLIEESRELLRLFVRIGSEDLRRGLIRLLRTMLEAPQSGGLTSGVPSLPLPSGANKPASNPRT